MSAVAYCPVVECAVMGECKARSVGMPEYCQSSDGQAVIDTIIALPDDEVIATAEPDAIERVQGAFDRAKETVRLRGEVEEAQRRCAEYRDLLVRAQQNVPRYYDNWHADADAALAAPAYRQTQDWPIGGKDDF